MSTAIVPFTPRRNYVYGGWDARQFFAHLPAQSVNTIVTSPPYFGLRDYGVDGQIGLEPTPAAYVAALVSVFREAKRALRDDGTLWVNIGDSYGHGTNASRQQSKNPGVGANRPEAQNSVGRNGLAEKQLIGIPWRLAFALQSDGWILRMDNIWHKPNPMPESVTDRPTKAHEYIFLLAKSARYYFDAEAIREENSPDMQRRAALGHTRGGRVEGRDKSRHDREDLAAWREIDANGRNKRSVWTVTTKPFQGAHFAVFPPDLIEPCILAGSPRGGVVCDPFMGSGTTALVAQKHGRDWYGCELNREYADMANHRVQGRFDEYQAKQRGEAYTPSLFGEVSA